jgi:plastocyanin
MLKRLAVLVLPVAVAGAVAVPALAATKTVAVKDDVFSSKALKISKGTTVKWVWEGKSFHNVTALQGSPAQFRSKLQMKGSFTHRFTKTGKYTIVCTIHSQMVSTVTVK